MSKGSVSVLGINGHIGHAAAKAFVAAGYAVTGFGRANRHPLAGVAFMAGDAGRVEDVKAAIEGADIVFNGLNLPYDKWDQGRAEAQLAVVIEAMGNSCKTMLYPGNVYNYAATDRHLAPSMAQQPQTPRGAIRVRQEIMLAEASRAGRFQTIILRAGDFYGPDSTDDWFDQAMMMDVNKGKIYHMADLDIGHAWAFLPDLAKAFTVLADQREQLAPFENFHFAGHFATNGQLMSALTKAWATPLKVAAFPWIILQAMALANGRMREILKMRYLWTNPMQLVDPRLDAMLGPDFGTPFDVAVAQTALPFARKTAA